MLNKQLQNSIFTDIRTIVSCEWLKTCTTELLRFSSRVLHWVEPHCSAEERTPEASIMVVLLCVCVCMCVLLVQRTRSILYSSGSPSDSPTRWLRYSSHDPNFVCVYNCDRIRIESYSYRYSVSQVFRSAIFYTVQ